MASNQDQRLASSSHPTFDIVALTASVGALAALRKDVLRQRTEDLDSANSFLESILSSLRASTVVLGQNCDILIWNRMAEETWGLRSDEVKGSSFFDLDIGLRVVKLKEPILTCLASGSLYETVMKARNRRGRPIRCHVTVNRQEGAQVKDRCIVLPMEEIDE